MTRRKRTPEAIERDRRILAANAAGTSLTDIAHGEGISRQRVRRIIDAAYMRAYEDLVPPGEAAVVTANRLRTQELARLDALWRAQFTLAVAGRENANDDVDRGVQDKAVGRCLAISERRAKLLGIDAPIRIDATLTVEERALRLAEAWAEWQAREAAAEAVAGAAGYVAGHGDALGELGPVVEATATET